MILFLCTLTSVVLNAQMRWNSKYQAYIDKYKDLAISEMLKYNREFVEKKEYEKYRTDKYPARKTAVLACMDTRLTELLPAALGVRNE